jgi:hypothetical protein
MYKNEEKLRKSGFVPPNLGSYPPFNPTGFNCRTGSVNSATERGWPLLTVETEVNGDSKRTHERAPFLVGSLGLLWPVQEFFCSALFALNRPSTKKILPHRTLFQCLSPHRTASWAGSRCWVACLLICVSGRGLKRVSIMCVYCLHYVSKYLEVFCSPTGALFTLPQK